MPIQATSGTRDRKQTFFAQNKIGIQHGAGTCHRQSISLTNAQRIAHIQRAGKFDARDIELKFP